MELRGPVTLGHALLLHEIRSPIVTGERMTLADLSNAVLVCAFDVKSARAGLRSAFRIAGMKIWGMWCGAMDASKQAERFNEWFSAHCSAPQAWKKGAVSGKDSAAPWPVQLLACAMSDFGMSRSDAEACSVRELQQLIAARGEAKGEAEFKTDREQRVIDWLKRNEVSTARN